MGGLSSPRQRHQIRMPPRVSCWRMLTSAVRVLPDFLIIGEMRCGTSSLYAYLREHPQIVRPWTKELHYIDRSYARGQRWYRANFATRAGMLWHRLRHSRGLTFEATPDYLIHPGAPRSLAGLVPNAKLIALDRAYSHYQFNVRNERERHPFAKALRKEEQRLAGERERILANPAYRSNRMRRYTYAARGRYLENLKAYERHFPREQMLIVKSEDLFERTQETYDAVLAFLGLSPWTLRRPESVNTASYSRERPAGYAELCDYFAPHNQRLYQYLGRDLGW
jgi:hypothetical protein